MEFALEPGRTPDVVSRRDAVRDLYGLPLTTSQAAADAYNRGARALLTVQRGALEGFAESIAHDPTFALGHAALALLGHECGAPVARQARVESARRHAPRGTERERSHVHAVLRHLDGDPAPMIAHLRAHPRDALLLSAAVPTIAFAGVTTVPADAWAIVERCGTAYGDDWWYAGLLAFVRQEQARFEESFELACRSLQEEPRAGHSVHARCHVHYETGDHGAGLSWLDGWITGGGQSADNLAHFSWHAALHELSLDDVTAVRARWDDQLAPPAVTGCRALVDSASLLWRWSLTSGPEGLPDAVRVLEHVDGDDIDHPPSGFMAMHAAVAVCAAGDVDRLHRLDHWCRVQSDPVLSGVAAPLAASLVQLGRGHGSVAADGLARLEQQIWRLGGSDAQREVVEDTRIAALLSAGRNAEARRLLDRRLDRRASPRDSLWREKSVSR